MKKSPFPTFISPQLLTLVEKPPNGKAWLHEVKFDGYRILAFISKNQVVLQSRNGKDWAPIFKNITEELHCFKSTQIIFDGEVVLLDKEGKSNFQLLQNSLTSKKIAFIYFIFDLLYYEYYDLRSLALNERKQFLKKILDSYHSPYLRYSDHIIENGQEVFENACHLGLEGIVSKNIDSAYISGRSKSWVKAKCLKEDEFVIGGFSNPKGQRKYFGSLFLGVFNKKNQLYFSGKVGTGFTKKSLEQVYKNLQKYRQEKNPFSSCPPGAKEATWVKPILVAQIAYTEWTKDNRLRHPVFKGLRLDLAAKAVRKKIMADIEKQETLSFKLTHPKKILYPVGEITKKDLLDYYDAVSDWILPFICNRPLTLLRCPNGYTHCFYQRHFNKTTGKFLKSITLKTDDKSHPYIYLADKNGLLSLVQMGVLEIHPWGSRIENMDYPDWITFDLDPGTKVSWGKIVSTAFDIKMRLEQLQLKSFVKTTGGKGLHVVVPIHANHSFETVKQFTKSFVESLAMLKPSAYVSNMSKAKRSGKIFIDYLRNQQTASAISVYSTRARPHAPISTPIFWEELSKNKKDTEFSIKTILNRLYTLKTDPWKSFWTLKQSLNEVYNDE